MKPGPSLPAIAGALFLLSIWAPGARVAQARDATAEGRYHLRKANALAGNDRCEAAIKEYGLAYEKLHDPIVLFNRAECYRRIGEDASAAADYRAFLDAVPGAPNRAEIEGKIAALDIAAAPGAAAHAARPTPVRPSRSPPAPIAVSPAVGAPIAPPPTVSEPSLVAPPGAPEIQVAEPVEGSGATRRGSLWIWAAIGVAVAGGAVGAYLVLRTPGATPPNTELGNFRF